MAGRKGKNTVDYYPHYCTGGKTIFILESKYGNDGYAIWFKLLELLGSSENHFVDCRDIPNWQYVVHYMNVDENTLKEVIYTLVTLGKIDKKLWDLGIIFSDKFIENIKDAYTRRKFNYSNSTELYDYIVTSMQLKPIYDENSSIDVDINTLESNLCQHQLSLNDKNVVINREIRKGEGEEKEKEKSPEKFLFQTPPEIQNINLKNLNTNCIISINDLEVELLHDEMWLESLAMKNRFDSTSAEKSIGIAKEWVKKFVLELKSENVKQKNRSDAFSHCSRWIAQQIQKGVKLTISSPDNPENLDFVEYEFLSPQRNKWETRKLHKKAYADDLILYGEESIKFKRFISDPRK